MTTPTDQATIDYALHLIRDELRRAMTLHAPMNSVAEGMFVLQEEVHELKKHARRKPHKIKWPKMQAEAAQVGAMAARFIVDLTADHVDPKPQHDDEVASDAQLIDDTFSDIAKLHGVDPADLPRSAPHDREVATPGAYVWINRTELQHLREDSEALTLRLMLEADQPGSVARLEAVVTDLKYQLDAERKKVAERNTQENDLLRIMHALFTEELADGHPFEALRRIKRRIDEQASTIEGMQRQLEALRFHLKDSFGHMLMPSEVFDPHAAIERAHNLHLKVTMLLNDLWPDQVAAEVTQAGNTFDPESVLRRVALNMEIMQGELTAAAAVNADWHKANTLAGDLWPERTDLDLADLLQVLHDDEVKLRHRVTDVERSLRDSRQTVTRLTNELHDADKKLELTNSLMRDASGRIDRLEKGYTNDASPTDT